MARRKLVVVDVDSWRQEAERKGIDPKDVVEFSQSRGISLRQAVNTGKYWNVRRRFGARAEKVFGQTAFDAYRAAASRFGAGDNGFSCFEYEEIE